MWIPCKERLPDKYDHVFIKTYDNSIRLAFIAHKEMCDPWHIPEGEYFKIINGGSLELNAVKEWYEL